MSNHEPVSDVRKRLREHWGNLERSKRSKFENEQGSSGITQDANTEVIDLTSEKESDDAETSETDISQDELQDVEESTSITREEHILQDSISSPPPTTIHPFRLMKSEIYDQNTSSEHFITLESMFGAPNLSKCWLFSFQFELDYILPIFAANTSITIIAQKGTILPATLQTPQILKLVANLETLLVHMPPYACHHSKLVVNKFKNGDCCIYIPSNNFTSAETNIPTQIVWCSPLLKRSPSASRPSAFRTALIRYLQGYRVDMKPVIAALEQVDFLPLDELGIEFVYSHPEIASSGLPLLGSRLQDQHHNAGDKDLTHHYLAQVSTIGSPIKSGLRSPGNLFLNFMIPLFSGLIKPEANTKRGTKAFDIPEYKKWLELNRIKPYIIYPTAEELRTSPMGYMAGGWFHYHWKRNEASRELYQKIKDWNVLYKRNPRAGSVRKSTPAHTKFLMKATTLSSDAAPFKEMDWVLFTTGNLSMNAWGTYSSKPRNYEVGVLFKSTKQVKIVIESAADLAYSNFNGAGRSLSETQSIDRKKLSVMIPFENVPIPYTGEDDSFCISAAYDEPDSLGNRHEPHA
ncbi:LAFA_0C04236g1_1 [Lachancea sp. 'fantastica']|nr:LAFA_0C04236g1_1 [Lachancea sp. 'fantastica']